MTDTAKLLARGIACPGCTGRSFRAVFTRHRTGATVRVRACRTCGHRIRTVERVESARA